MPASDRETEPACNGSTPVKRMTSASEPATELARESWLPYERAIHRFEEAWKHGPPPALEDYLPAGTVCPRAALVELVHTDLEFRLKAGKPARIEEYWRRYPELAQDRAVALDLILAEYDLRRRREPDLARKEYLARFPQYGSELLSAWHGGSSSSAEAAPGVFKPSCLGKYELLEVVGRGAFGVVYRAHDCDLQRTVAVKIPRPGNLEIPEETERFLREARSAAQLQHPHIVTLHDVGQANGTCYLVYEFVHGTTLRAWLAANRLGYRPAAELIVQVAAALDYAHRQGIIHRDLKPSNILLDPAGQPHLMDFGLAKWETGEGTLTREGELLGTPAYMSPEQARGEANRLDGRSDIYSLGVILYEMLTGELPFRGNPRMLLQQMLEEEPRPPRQLDDRIPRDLENICLKAIDKNPASRYASAAALADDLRSFLQGRPVQARPIRMTGRLWRWTRRKPIVAGLSLALLVVTVLGFAGVLFAWSQAERERQRAVANFDESERQRQEAAENFHKAHRAVSEFAGLSFNTLLRDTPGLDPVRLELMEKALKYYEDFLHQRSDDPALRAEIATATLQLAQLYFDLVPHRKKAPATARKALQLWQEVVRAQPARPEFRRQEANAYATLGHIQRFFDQKDEARQSLERACAFYVESAQPSDVDAQRELASCYFDLGLLERARGRPVKALLWHQKACAVAREVAHMAPTAPAPRELLWHTLSGLAHAQLEMGHAIDALRVYQDALAAMKLLAEEYPLIEDFQGSLAVTYHLLGNAATDAHHYGEAVGFYRHALPIREKLSQANPHNVKRCSDLGGTWHRLGQALEHLERHEEALAAYQQASTCGYRVCELQPTIVKHRQWLSDRFGDIARLQRELGRPVDFLHFSEPMRHASPTSLSGVQ